MQQYYGVPYGAQGGYPGPPHSITSSANSWRERELATFLAMFPHARQLDYDRSEFELALQTSHGRLPLIVLVPLHFPNERPHFRVPPRVIVGDPCVDPSGRVLTDRLRSWKPDTSLAQVVREVVDNFERGARPYIQPMPASAQQASHTCPPAPGQLHLSAGYSEIPGHAQLTNMALPARHSQPAASPAHILAGSTVTSSASAPPKQSQYSQAHGQQHLTSTSAVSSNAFPVTSLPTMESIASSMGMESGSIGGQILQDAQHLQPQQQQLPGVKNQSRSPDMLSPQMLPARHLQGKPPKAESSASEESDPVAQAAVSALEAAVAAEAAKASGAGGVDNSSGLQRANSLRSLRTNSASYSRRARSGKLKRSESLIELAFKSQPREAKPASHGSGNDMKNQGPGVGFVVDPNCDQVVLDAALALEEAVAREAAQQGKQTGSMGHAIPVQSYVTAAQDLLASNHAQPVNFINNMNQAASTIPQSGQVQAHLESFHHHNSYNHHPLYGTGLAVNSSQSDGYDLGLLRSKSMEVKSTASDILNLPNDLFEYSEVTQSESEAVYPNSYSEQSSDSLFSGLADEDDFSKMLGDLSVQSLGLGASI